MFVHLYLHFLIHRSICAACVKAESVEIIPKYRYQRSGHFAHVESRVAIADHTRVIARQKTEAVTGEVVGPVVFAREIKQIENTYEANGDERENALNELFQALDEENADNQERDDERVEKLTAIAKAAEEEFPAFHSGKLQIIQDKRNAKRQAEIAKRLMAKREVYDKISAQLDGFEHKEVALACDWFEGNGGCQFEYKPSNACLGNLVDYPRRVTRPKIERAVEAVREAYDLLHANGFLIENYLGFVAGSERTADQSLHDYCVAKYPSFESLLSSGGRGYYCSYNWDSFIGSLREGNATTALCRLLNYNDLKEAFASKVSSLIGARRQSTRKKFKKLAENIWERHRTRSQPAAANETIDEHNEYKSNFRRCRTIYNDFIRKWLEYQRRPQTIAFLAGTGPPTHRANQTFTRKNALDKVSFTTHVTKRFIRNNLTVA